MDECPLILKNDDKTDAGIATLGHCEESFRDRIDLEKPSQAWFEPVLSLET